MSILLPSSDIISFWFGKTLPTETNSFWFDQSPDEYITTTYKHLVDGISQNVQLYLHNIYSHTSLIDRMALLLIGDQFTRNIYRHDTAQRTKNDQWALSLALEMIEKDEDLTLPLHYRYFILLPLRHAKQSPLLRLVCERIQTYINEFQSQFACRNQCTSECEDQCQCTCKYKCTCTFDAVPRSLVKFYNHTIRNYTDQTDEINVTDISNKTEFNLSSLLNYYQLILEKPPNKSCIDIEPCQSIPDLIRHFSTPTQRIAVSLSGGVDSMIVLDSLLKSGRFHVCAIHIQYNNRTEALYEREFLSHYCSLLGIPFYYRIIHYMKRTDPLVDRECFEQESKRARFNLYRYVMEKENLDGICLGHHQGDILENVFTNMIKGRDTKDIKGMSSVQFMFDTTLFRPFLGIPKDTIIEYAHFHDIPYFLNTTPTWSCRGVLRNQVIPDLKKQFGCIETNIIAFADRVSYLEQFYQEEMKKKLDETIMIFGTRVRYCAELVQMIQPTVLQMMHTNGYAMISKKAMKTLVDWLDGPKKNQLELCKDVFCFYDGKYVYFVNESKIKKEKPSQEQVEKEFTIPPKLKKMYNL